MEQLAELIIRVLISLFEGKSIKPTQRLAPIKTPAALPRGTAKPARRLVRRAATTVAVAKPIVTSFSSEPVTPMQRVTAKSASAANIAPSTVPNQSAAAIRKWLEPSTLKKQFLLTEILQPPLALRQSQRHSG